MLLIQKLIYKEMYGATRMLVYLKRAPVRRMKWGDRFVNIILMMMHILAPMILTFVNVIVLA